MGNLIGRPVSLLPVLLLVAGCNDPPTGLPPAQLVLLQAPSPVGGPGFPLADTLKVRLVDPSGNPRPGVQVSWQVREGGGSIVAIADVTDADGIAAAIWTLGGRPGMNRARASTFEESSVDFQSMGDVFRVGRLASEWRMGCGLVGGALWCWGRRFWANTVPASIYQVDWHNFSPGLVDDTHDFIDVAVTAQFVCAVDHQGAVWCASEAAPQVAQVAGLPPIRGLVGRGFGPARFCGIALSDSTAWCWPSGGPPARVPGSPAFLRLWTDLDATCGLRVDSTAACWGKGPLGDGTLNSSNIPVSVSGGHPFVELGVGFGFACGRTAIGEAWCWGRDGKGFVSLAPAWIANGVSLIGAEDSQLLRGGLPFAMTSSPGVLLAPHSPSGLDGVPVERFGGNGISCVQLAGGEVYCAEDMWNGWTGSYNDLYHPVPPLRSVPPAP